MLSEDPSAMDELKGAHAIGAGSALAPSWSSVAAPQLLALKPARVVEPVAWVGHAPFVMWMVERWQPGQIVALGVDTGNAFFALCQAVARSGFACATVGVDEWARDSRAAAAGSSYDSVRAYCETSYGSFASLMRCSFDDALRRFADGAIDLLHLDGCRDYDAVRHDYQSWLPKLSDQGVILLHGIQRRDEGAGGASRLWTEVKRYYPHCEFAHSEGLGVLFVGRAMEPGRASLRDALSKAGAAEPLHGLFTSFGGLLASEREASLKIDAVGADLRRLTREIESRGSALARLQAILESVRAERDEAKGRAARTPELDAALAQSRSEHEALERRLAEAHGELLAREAHRVELRAEIDRLHAEMDRVRQQALAASAAEVEQLRRQVAAAESLRAEVRHLQSECEGIRTAVDARDAEIELLRAALSGSAEAHRASAAKAEMLEHELRAQVERLAGRAAELAATVDWQQRDLEVFRGEIPRLEQRIAEQGAALVLRAQELESQRLIAHSLRAIVDERWRERVALFTCRTWRLWAPVREVLTRVIRRRKNISMRLAIADAWGALRGRPPLDPPPWRDPSLDGLHE